MKLPIVPLLKDVTQSKRIIEVPEIRVWIHNTEGDDYYKVFPNFNEALAFCEKNKDAEDNPLIAFKGYEINLWGLR